MCITTDRRHLRVSFKFTPRQQDRFFTHGHVFEKVHLLLCPCRAQQERVNERPLSARDRLCCYCPPLPPRGGSSNVPDILLRKRPSNCSLGNCLGVPSTHMYVHTLVPRLLEGKGHTQSSDGGKISTMLFMVEVRRG